MSEGVSPSGTSVVAARGRTVLVHRRTAATYAVVVLACLVLAAVSLLTGTYPVSWREMRAILSGAGGQPARFLVLQQRLPRALAALLVGAALGGAGAIFQSTSRNPLASPDVIGFTTGAATGGLVTILLRAHPTSGSVAVGALAGGAGTALAVALLSSGSRRGIDRLVLIGVAVAAMLASVNEYLISRADLDAAETAVAWRHGSLNAITWQPVVVLALGMLVLGGPFLALARPLRLLELGDDCAAALGVDLRRTRGLAMVLGVAATALAVATAGPVGFVALGAPQAARRLCGTPGVPWGASALVGAALLASADLAAQRLLSPTQIPVGYVTAAIGGAYLLRLLLRRPG